MSLLRALVLMLVCLFLMAAGGTTKAQAADSRSELSSHIKQYLEAKGSPLAPYSDDFVKYGNQFGVDPLVVVAISGAETNFGTNGKPHPPRIHNAWGLGPGFTYGSWPEGIRAATKNLAGPYYLGENRFTIAEIGSRWAPHKASNDPRGLNANWPRNVSTYYKEIGGDPTKSIFRKRSKAPDVARDKEVEEQKQDPSFDTGLGIEFDSELDSITKEPRSISNEQLEEFAKKTWWILLVLYFLGKRRKRRDRREVNDSTI